MTDLLMAAALGFIQGVTEFLPVSSSGHLVLLQDIFNIERNSLLFETALHAATLVAVIIFFRKRLLKSSFHDLIVLGVGTIPAVIVGLGASSLIKGAFSSSLLVGVTLLITAGINVLTDRLLERQKTLAVETTVKSKTEINGIANTSFTTAFIVGMYQAVAIIPGISRSGSTILGGLTRGFTRMQAFEFSFLLSVPAILGAMTLQVVELMDGSVETIATQELAAGMITAFISGLLSLKLLQIMIVKARFEWFAWYCGALGIITILVNL